MKPSKSVATLIVDDSLAMRRVVRDIVGSLPKCEIVGEGVNGQEALELVCRHQPALVIMDINMPEMGGIEALRALRSESPMVQVVMMSSALDPETRDMVLDLGAMACFEKGSDLSTGLPPIISSLSTHT